MAKLFGQGTVTAQLSGGLWQARFQDKRVTYSEARFGEHAEALAYRALRRLQTGNFDPVTDELCFKHSWRMQDAAKQLDMSIGQLRLWMLTGVVNGREIIPPKRDVKGVDRITGFELMMALERLAP